MKRITTGALAQAIQRYRPVVTSDMVRGWAESGLLTADRNPGNDRGWWYVLPDFLAESLMQMDFTPDEINGVLRLLGVGEGKQCHFF